MSGEAACASFTLLILSDAAPLRCVMGHGDRLTWHHFCRISRDEEVQDPPPAWRQEQGTVIHETADRGEVALMKELLIL